MVSSCSSRKSKRNERAVLINNKVKGFLSYSNFAVAGSFKNEAKYAYKILNALKQKGRNVYAVNPRLKEVSGTPCYPTVKDIPGQVDVVSLVTPPDSSEKIVRECKEKNITKIWFQPGAESENALKFCSENQIDVICNLCVLIESV